MVLTGEGVATPHSLPSTMSRSMLIIRCSAPKSFVSDRKASQMAFALPNVPILCHIFFVPNCVPDTAKHYGQETLLDVLGERHWGVAYAIG